MKPIKQHLSELPEPHRTNAINAAFITMLDMKVENTYDALFLAVNWNNEPGMDYWEELHDSIVEGRAFNG